MIRRLPFVALAAALSLSVASCSSPTSGASSVPDAGVSEKAQQAPVEPVIVVLGLVALGVLIGNLVNG